MAFSSMPLCSLFLVCALALIVAASPLLETLADAITPLSTANIKAYKPYTHYAGAAYCMPAMTLAWSCGVTCAANSGFKPVASGGDGAVIQYWYVGYDTNLNTVIVGYQGTDPLKILPLLTDVSLFLDKLNPTLFPGVSVSAKIHNGFKIAHELSALSVLVSVKKTMLKYSSTKVTLVGHSLGGALALISSVYLPLHLPFNTTIRTVTYGMPRVGNQAFVDLVNSGSNLTRIVNKKDEVAIIPGRFLNFTHPIGEVHITDDNAWMSCPGQDNTNSECTIGYVPNILVGNIDDHSGPYDGVAITC